MAEEFPKVTAEDFASLLRVHFEHDEPICVLAMPGVGKSRLVERVAQDFFGVPFHPFIGSTRQPTDLMGMPVPDVPNGKMVWLPPGQDDLPQAAPGCIFADELTSAPLLVQSACLQLFGKERRAGSYRCLPGIGRVAAGNRPEDKTGAGRLITALGNRMTVVQLEVDVEQWCKWARVEKLRPEVIAYIRWHAKDKTPALVDWDSNRVINATPRSWEKVSRMLGSFQGELRQQFLSGTVGIGHGAGFEGFLRIWQQIEDPEAVLKAPHTAKVYDLTKPDGVALTFALCSALAQRCSLKTASAILRYANRLSPEFSLCLVQDAGQVDLMGLTSVKEYQQFVTEHPELYR